MANEAHGQFRILKLQKSYKKTMLNFFEGDVISFRISGYRHLYSGIINEIRDSSIIVNYEEIPVDLIRQVIIFKQGRFQRLADRLSKRMPVAGALYLVSDVINNLYFGFAPLITPSTWIVAGSFFAGALLAKTFISRTYHVRGRKQLKIIEFPY